jgi:hypothetical protein
MAKRRRLNREAIQLEPFPEIEVTVKDPHPLRRWLEQLWATVSDPKTLITLVIVGGVRGCVG